MEDENEIVDLARSYISSLNYRRSKISWLWESPRLPPPRKGCTGIEAVDVIAKWLFLERNIASLSMIFLMVTAMFSYHKGWSSEPERSNPKKKKDSEWLIDCLDDLNEKRLGIRHLVSQKPIYEWDRTKKKRHFKKKIDSLNFKTTKTFFQFDTWTNSSVSANHPK